MNDRNDQTALIYVNAKLPPAQRHPGIQVTGLSFAAVYL